MSKEIVMIIIISGILVLLVIALLIIKKIEKYRKKIYLDMIKNYEEFFRNLSLVDNKYLPYYETHSANIDFKINSKGDIDELINLKIKKHYKFYHDRLLYFFNDSLSCKPNIVGRDNKPFFELNEKIKKINILATFENGTHILAKYFVIKYDNGLKLILDESEVKEDESQENITN